ncbi:hypothetical protein VTJ49DRAFT_7589 [Mycothermus thermophilus]|uniref:Uncharacterized protein n=1 Tax=Humicola insolens TaxID=85995 RepID=A0ABR3VGJ0_HUMIN
MADQGLDRNDVTRAEAERDIEKGEGPSNEVENSVTPDNDARRGDDGGADDSDSDAVLSIHDEMDYEERVFRYTFNLRRRDPQPMFLIFRSLQQLNLVRLQNDLARIKTHVWQEKRLREEDSARLTTLLHDYTTVIRDYNYLRTLVPITGSQAQNNRTALEQAFGLEVGDFTDDGGGYGRFPDPNRPPSDNLRDFLKRHLPRSVTYTRADKLRRFEEYLRGLPAEDVSPLSTALLAFSWL